MSAVDRDFVLELVNAARETQESEAQLSAEGGFREETAIAETRSYSVALLADALNEGLLEQLHADAQAQFLIDSAYAGFDEAAERAGREMDQAAESTGHLPGYAEGGASL